MDGNGRWAKKRHMPRFFGHKQGVDALVRTVHACADRGIEYLTVFAFSSENWKRPSEEVSGLMGLVLVAVSKYLAKLAGDGVRVRIVGDRAPGVRQAAPGLAARRGQHAPQHAGSTSRSPSTTAAAGTSSRPAGRRWPPASPPHELDEATLNSYMALSYAPDPDLFIRTGGELRISNFLLWQAAYSELVFTECLWPEFGSEELDAALAQYARRERRFGAVPSAAELVASGS